MAELHIAVLQLPQKISHPGLKPFSIGLRVLNPDRAEGKKLHIGRKALRLRKADLPTVFRERPTLAPELDGGVAVAV